LRQRESSSYLLPVAAPPARPKDDFILELAVESRADFVLTFNTRDFAGAERFGIRVVSPREFLAIIEEVP
jgi:predicted nucleic acid-binding protein